MKQEIQARPRVTALLLAAVALPFAPAFAQDAQPALAAPTVVLPSPATAPETVPAPAPEPAPAPVMAPSVPVVQPLPERPAPVTAAEEPAAPIARSARPHVAPSVSSTASATRAAAPAATSARVEAAPGPVAKVAPPPPVPAAAPIETAPVAADTVQTSTQKTRATGPWLWIAGGVAIALALLGFLFSRRRRASEDPYSEDAYADDLAYEDARSAAAPVVDAARPWIELGMRPVRAGTEGDDAVVEFELTVDNSGPVAAKDVCISTWMFSGAPGGSEAERALIAPPAEASLTTLDIPAGDGEQVDAKLALAAADMAGEAGAAFTPVVVADARYPLPDGGEGRISASFAIGVSEDGEIAPFPAGMDEMREDIEARLHGELERA